MCCLHYVTEALCRSFAMFSYQLLPSIPLELPLSISSELLFSISFELPPSISLNSYPRFQLNCHLQSHLNCYPRFHLNCYPQFHLNGYSQSHPNGGSWLNASKSLSCTSSISSAHLCRSSESLSSSRATSVRVSCAMVLRAFMPFISLMVVRNHWMTFFFLTDLPKAFEISFVLQGEY